MRDPAATPPRSVLPTILGASLLSTLGAMPVFLLAVQASFVQADLHFSASRLGLTVAAFFASAATTTLLGGRWLGGRSPRTTTMLTGAISAAGGLGVGLAVDGWPALVALMTLLGAANATAQMTSNLSLARGIPPGRRGFGFGLKQSAIPAAILVSGMLVPLVSGQYGWRPTFVGVGVAGCVVIVAGWFRRDGTAPPADADLDVDRSALAPLLVMMVAMTLASGAANALGSFGASWGHQIGVSPARAGLVMALASALNIAVRLVGGFLADQRYGRNLPVVALQCGVGAVALLAMSFADGGTWVPVSLVAFAVGWSWPGLLMYAVVRVSRDSVATASGLLQAGAFAGGALGPLTFGFLVDWVGYPTTWRWAAVAFGVGAGLVLLARRMIIDDLVRRPPREPLGYGGARSSCRRAASRSSRDAD